MKKTFLYSLIPLFMLPVFFSCSDDDNGKEEEEPKYELSESIRDTLYINFDEFTEVNEGLYKYTIEFDYPVEVDTSYDYYRFILADGKLSSDVYFIYSNTTYEVYYETGEYHYTLYITSPIIRGNRVGIMLVIVYQYKYYIE